jgi:hypothetical protein
MAYRGGVAALSLNFQPSRTVGGHRPSRNSAKRNTGRSQNPGRRSAPRQGIKNTHRQPGILERVTSEGPSPSWCDQAVVDGDPIARGARPPHRPRRLRRQPDSQKEQRLRRSAQPRAATSRAFMSGSARAKLISLLSFSIISAGVLLGAPIPYQPWLSTLVQIRPSWERWAAPTNA